MKVLLQHPHAPGVISGVLTYCTLTRAALATVGVEATVFSTHGAGTLALWRAVRAVDLVHLNSNHLRLVWCARLQGKPVLIKYHYPFWDELMEAPHEPMRLARRFRRDTGFIWRHSAPAGFGPARWKHNAMRFVRAVLRLVVARAVHARLACSEFIARSSDLPWPIEVDYNPAPFPEQPPGRITAPGSVPVFLFVGRLDEAKGVDVLLEAAAILAQGGRRFGIEIVGDGGDGERFRAQAERLGLADTVRFLGRLPPARTLEHMGRSLAVIVPSRWNEAAPYVIVEAATTGRCCIGARRGGIPELIGAAGLTFESENAGELAEHLERLLDRPDEAAERGRAAYAYLRSRCDVPVAAARLAAVYRRLSPL